MPVAKCRVLIVDDHPALRAGIAQFVEAQDDLMVCGEAGTVIETLALMDNSRPDVVLLDLVVEHHDGIALVKDLRGQWPKIPILVYSMHREEVYAPRVLKAGAMGFLEKSRPPGEVIEALRKVLAGDVALTRRMYTRMCQTAAAAMPVETGDDIAAKLSDRELHVFQMLGSGLGTAEIAAALHVSRKTVSAHRENIKVKLGISTADKLIEAAARWMKDQ